MVISQAFSRLRYWFSRLVYRPADLFDIASGFTTFALVVLMAWNHDEPTVAPSMSFLGDVMPSWVWLALVGLAAILQPVALHLDDPNDPRHPVLQPWKWVRNSLALIVGAWFFILYWSLWLRLGPHHVAALYGLMVCMNAYIVAHVMFRTRD